MIRLFAIALLLISSETIAQKLQFLALGDSYTIGESVTAAERWPAQLVAALRKQKIEIDDPHIIATTGWRTDELKSAIEKANLKNTYNLVSLLIGVNNQYQGKPAEQYAVEFQELLQTAVSLAGANKSHVFVISIPDYGYTPFGQSKQQEITKALDHFNALNESITEKAGIKYVNITDISRKGLSQPDLVAGDGLHPSGKMYTLWVERILKTLRPEIGE